MDWQIKVSPSIKWPVVMEPQCVQPTREMSSCLTSTCVARLFLGKKYLVVQQNCTWRLTKKKVEQCNFFNYFLHFTLRFTDLVHISVIGGELDMISPQEVSKKFADELAVTLLNSRGRVGYTQKLFFGVQNHHLQRT